MPIEIKEPEKMNREADAVSLDFYLNEPADDKAYLYAGLDADSLFHAFLQEASAHHSDIQTELNLLKSGQSADIQRMYRLFHVLQNQWGFLGFYQMRRICGETENILELFLDGKRTLDEDSLDLIVRVLASFRAQAERIVRGIPIKRIEVWDADAVLMALENQVLDLKSRAGQGTVDNLAMAFMPALENAKYFKIREEKMEELLELLADLTLSQSALPEDAKGKTGGKNVGTSPREGKVTKKIRDLLLSIRQSSVSPLFEQASWAVQRYALMTGKNIQLTVEGADIHVDRPILSALSGPLLQLLKNAVEHGIEPEAERVAAGKTAEGRLKLKATQQAGSFLLEVEDDGRGLDLDKLRKRGVALGMIRDEKTSASRVMEMIFKPGVTTLDEAEEGRGAGLDQVETLVESLYGSIRVQSRQGQGCKFLLKVPQSQSLVEGWVIEAAEKQWLLPISQVLKITHPSPMSNSKSASHEDSPLALDLAEWLGEESKSATPKFSVHVESGARQFRILVDEVLGKQQVLVKKSGEKKLGKLEIRGEAILSDGKVAFILDTVELLKFFDKRQGGQG
jgi:two-component system chemotaxis sensor kinase CheA